ncbi:MAG TPA: hypothetical protein VK369_10675, partial [Segetibacter sp.]|nr:hypothetical protein [Segetibacter sp.]
DHSKSAALIIVFLETFIKVKELNDTKLFLAATSWERMADAKKIYRRCKRMSIDLASFSFRKI